MSDPQAAKVQRLIETALEGPGELSSGLRKAIAGEAPGEIPSILLPYLDKVAHRAYTVTDEDVEALKRAGFTEDQIFEATVAAAVGAALKRLRAGLAALDGRPAGG
jgi:alkylhydroperoxidase family enzyme